MFGKLLIANRGEIAVRIVRTARRLGIRTVAVYSDADVDSLHVEMADEALRIGPPPAAQSYLDQGAVIEAARRSGAEAIHPGYGFLAENPDFAGAVAKAGLTFVGPPPAAIRAMGLKDEAKRLMAKAGVPLLPGYHGADQDIATLKKEAKKIGYPVLLKPVAGGGGKGMRRVDSAAELEAEIAASQREAQSSFGNRQLLLEKFVTRARHIEVQIMADAHGNAVHLFERDCSLQRRHQKVIEETPAPGLTGAMREDLCAAAIAAVRSVGYVGAGTVEFLADISEGLKPDRFYFMEMNTRLQVEHPVTEMVTGLDLVELQLRLAAGEVLPIKQNDVQLSGHAVEARLYAEDPSRDFQPQTGRLIRVSFPAAPFLRIDTGVRAGDSVLPYYDPMISKLIVHAPTRQEAVSRLAGVVAQGHVAGCRTNLDFLHRLLRHPSTMAGDIDTGLIAKDLDALLDVPAPPIEAIAAAMLFASGYLLPTRGHSPFETLRGFRLWGGETLTHGFTVGGKRLQATLRGSGPFVAESEAGSLSFQILSFDDQELRLDCGDRIATLTILHHDAELTVVCNQSRHQFHFASDLGGGESTEGRGIILSPMPGQVRKILVVAGAQIERGAAVVIIEAMKMELSLKAERSGKVMEVNVREGDQIAEGTTLLEIGEDDG
jgi:3-methylcrotonyl-CoA carboxylase alpha subunit